MAITTVEPGKNEEIDPADAAEATVNEDLQWRSKDLEEMFGTKLSDDALGFDEETFDVQVSEEESLERDGNDFTEHAFAAVHSGQRSMLAARGGGNVNDKDHSIHGDPKAPKDPYQNAMLMSALYSGTAQQIALRNAMDQADAVRRSMENAAAAKAQYQALEQARADAEARGDTIALAAIDEDLSEAALEVVQQADSVQSEMDQMGRSIDSMAIEIAATRALSEGSLDEAAANAAKEEIRDAGASGFIDRETLSDNARLLYDEAQPISMQMRSRIDYAMQNGGDVDLEGLDADVRTQTEAIVQRFDGMIHDGIMPANRLTSCGPEDETVVAAAQTLGIDRGGILGDLDLPGGTAPLSAGERREATSVIGQNTGVTLTAGSGFDSLTDSVTTAAALGGGLEERNGFTADTFAASVEGPAPATPGMEPGQTPGMEQENSIGGTIETWARKITDPIYSMFN